MSPRQEQGSILRQVRDVRSVIGSYEKYDILHANSEVSYANRIFALLHWGAPLTSCTPRQTPKSVSTCARKTCTIVGRTLCASQDVRSRYSLHMRSERRPSSSFLQSRSSSTLSSLQSTRKVRCIRILSFTFAFYAQTKLSEIVAQFNGLMFHTCNSNLLKKELPQN